jgi:cytochrome P450
VLVTSPKGIAEVLVTRNYEFPKPSAGRGAISRILGDSILVAEGDQHKLQRRKLLPAFAFRHIKDLYPVFWQKAREGTVAMTGHVRRLGGSGSGSSAAAETDPRKSAVPSESRQ